MRLAGVVFFFLLTARDVEIHCRKNEPRSVTIRHDPPSGVYRFCKAGIRQKLTKIYIVRCSRSFERGFDQFWISMGLPSGLLPQREADVESTVMA